jgi:hypothetical protein
MRRLRLFLAGMIFMLPAPYYRDYRWYANGQTTTCWIVVAVFFAAIFGAGVFVGKVT